MHILDTYFLKSHFSYLPMETPLFKLYSSVPVVYISKWSFRLVLKEIWEKKNTFIYAFTSINKQPQDDFGHDFGPNLNV